MKKIALIFLLLSVSLIAEKSKEEFRIYNDDSPKHVKNFYFDNHTFQTVNFVKSKHGEYIPLRHGNMSVWEAIALLDKIVDESDPDTKLNQTYHSFQTAEAMRKGGLPRWMILTGLIHDLGKLLTSYGEPQWAVVGDTFSVGCAYSKKIVFPGYFLNNPDQGIPHYQTKYGIYSPNCGLDQLLMSWGHDEYLYQVMKNHLPKEALYIIRFHSFSAAHREGAYKRFYSTYDQKMLPWLKTFSQYDLYSKTNEELDIEALRPFYVELAQEFLPDSLSW